MQLLSLHSCMTNTSTIKSWVFKKKERNNIQKKQTKKTNEQKQNLLTFSYCVSFMLISAKNSGYEIHLDCIKLLVQLLSVLNCMTQIHPER